MVCVERRVGGCPVLGARARQAPLGWLILSMVLVGHTTLAEGRGMLQNITILDSGAVREVTNATLSEEGERLSLGEAPHRLLRERRSLLQAGNTLTHVI